MSDDIFNRRSIRKYTEQTVEDEKIKRLLEAAFVAPSAGNQRPWEFYVVKNKDVIKQLSQSSPYAGCADHATVCIVPCYQADHLPCPEYPEIDLSAAVENILIEATALGLGAVWLGIAPIEERMECVADILSLPDDLKAFAIIPVGYPAEEKEAENRYDERKVHYVE